MALAGIRTQLRRWLLGRKAYKFFLRDWIALGDLQRAADAMATMRFSQSLVATLLPGPAAQRILVVAPHPDDEMMGPGGTVMGALDDGKDVSVVYLSRGRDGTAGDVLCAEAQAVADRLGYQTNFLRFPLRGIPVDKAAVEAFSSAVAEAAPQALFIPFLLDDHDDHRRASHLLLRAAESGKLPADIEVWAYQVYTPLPGNVAVDITARAERKAEAIRSFTSQMKIRDWPHWALGLNAFNSRFIPTGGAPRYVECFFVLPLDAYVDLCRHYFADGTVYHQANYRAGD